jgi:uncharacterized protein (TIGR00266 family)
MKCHEVDYKIYGNDMQLVEVELDPNETVIAEAGSMSYFENGINFEAKMGDGSKVDQGWLSTLFEAGKRVMTGESLFLTHFTNKGSGKKNVAFAAPYPGKIITLDMKEYGEILCQKDSFLAAALGTEISIAFTKRFGAGLFGGEGFILQRLIGDGLCFIHAGGTIVKKELKNESISIDTGCLMAFTKDLDYSIERSGNLKSMFFGGEGFFLAKIQGTGTVWIQSMPFSRLADRVIASAPRAMGKSQGESGGFGSL